LKDECVKLNLNIAAKYFVLDYEVPIHKAVVHNFPQAEIMGCKFHLGQAWFRKIQNCGLTSEFKNTKSAIGKWPTQLFGLSYLNPNEVGECFAFDIVSECPDDERAKQFCDYIVENYIEDDAAFPPVMWAKATSSLERSTNCCESFHSHFNSSFYHSHPPIFEFLEVLRNYQVDTYLKINSTVQRDDCIDYTKRNEKISKMLNDYENKNISRKEFIKMVSYCNRPKKNFIKCIF
jgi:hypothetical protein